MELRGLTPENWEECASLSVGEGQRDFVDENLYAIAEAGVKGYVPYALYDGETLVGMLVLAELPERTAGIHHVMVGERFQGRGYGRAAMAEALRKARESLESERVILSYWPGNPAVELYKSLGFAHTGEKRGEEPVMELRF